MKIRIAIIAACASTLALTATIAHAGDPSPRPSGIQAPKQVIRTGTAPASTGSGKAPLKTTNGKTIVKQNREDLNFSIRY